MREHSGEGFSRADVQARDCSERLSWGCRFIIWRRRRTVISAWYMRFVPGHNGALDRVGGLPTHLPPVSPTAIEGHPLRFLAQLYCDGTRLNLPGTLCLHLYQDHPDGDPFPVPVLVPLDAKPNVAGLGISDSRVIPHDIEWEYREVPDESDSDQVELAASKIGGACYFSHALDAGERLLLFLDEDPADFNFGGDECMLAFTATGGIRLASA